MELLKYKWRKAKWNLITCSLNVYFACQPLLVFTQLQYVLVRTELISCKETLWLKKEAMHPKKRGIKKLPGQEGLPFQRSCLFFHPGNQGKVYYKSWHWIPAWMLPDLSVTLENPESKRTGTWVNHSFQNVP